MGSWKLRFSMVGSLALVIGLTTLGLTIILTLFTGMSFNLIIPIMLIFFLGQWYFGPRLVEKSMKVEEASKDKYPKLHETVEQISQRSGIEKPEVMISKMDMPNAFAYGNFLTERKVAVTEGLLKTLEYEEVEAVLGHELGHIKHKDSEIMMFLSILPAIFMMIGRMMLWSTLFGGGRREEGGGTVPLIAIGAFSMMFYFLLNLGVMWSSRIREFYADEHAAKTVQDGSRKLSEGLAKINESMAKMKQTNKGTKSRRTRRSSQNNNSNPMGLTPFGSGLKPLFISDPDTASPLGGKSDQEIVRKYRNKELSTGEKIFELFSTHPNISKRLQALKDLSIY